MKVVEGRKNVATVPNSPPKLGGEFGAHSAAAIVMLCAVTLAAQTGTPPIQFTDVTKTAGINFTHYTGAFGKKYLPETLGPGVAFIDYDGDGWQDLFFTNGKEWPGQPHRPSTSH